MQKIADEAYEFKGTRFHLRAFTDPLNEEKPVFVIEEAQKDSVSLSINRVELAKELAKEIGTTPDQVTWLEQAPDGSMKQVEFKFTHTDQMLPNSSDMRRGEAQEAERAGIEPVAVDRYNTREFEVERREFQAQVGDALEPYQKRQNEEFSKMELPPSTIGFEEMQRFPSQHEFENEPHLKL